LNSKKSQIRYNNIINTTEKENSEERIQYKNSNQSIKIDKRNHKEKSINQNEDKKDDNLSFIRMNERSE
jgi:hypothetical protein